MWLFIYMYMRALWEAFRGFLFYYYTALIDGTCVFGYRFASITHSISFLLYLYDKNKFNIYEPYRVLGLGNKMTSVKCWHKIVSVV